MKYKGEKGKLSYLTYLRHDKINKHVFIVTLINSTRIS